MRKNRSVLGLDVSTSSVKVVELSLAGGQYRVDCMAVEAMPHNAINDRAVADPQAVGAPQRFAQSRGRGCRQWHQQPPGQGHPDARCVARG